MFMCVNNIRLIPGATNEPTSRQPAVKTAPSPPGKAPMTLHAPTIFLGSFLLFLVQPLIGRYILPWFGGGPAVWTTCMLFFQMMLLTGYGYAHGATLLKRSPQGKLHLALLVAALPFLPIIPADNWRPVAS